MNESTTGLVCQMLCNDIFNAAFIFILSLRILHLCIFNQTKKIPMHALKDQSMSLFYLRGLMAPSTKTSSFYKRMHLDFMSTVCAHQLLLVFISSFGRVFVRPESFTYKSHFCKHLATMGVGGSFLIKQINNREKSLEQNRSKSLWGPKPWYCPRLSEFCVLDCTLLIHNLNSVTLPLLGPKARPVAQSLFVFPPSSIHMLFCMKVL